MTDNWNTCWWSLSSWEQREKLTKHLESKFLQERFSLCGFLTHTHTHSGSVNNSVIINIWSQTAQWIKESSEEAEREMKSERTTETRTAFEEQAPSNRSLFPFTFTCSNIKSLWIILSYIAAASLATHHQQSSGHQLLSLQSESFDVLLPRSKFQKQEANMMKVRLSLGPNVVADCHWVRVLLSLRSRRCLYVMKLGLHLIWIKTHSDVEGGKEKLASYFHSHCVCLTHSTKEQIHNSTKIQLKIKMYLRANITLNQRFFYVFHISNK